jgi:hypothetical protein
LFASLETCCGNHETGERLARGAEHALSHYIDSKLVPEQQVLNTAANGPRVVRLALPSSTAAPVGCRIVSLRT